MRISPDWAPKLIDFAVGDVKFQLLRFVPDLILKFQDFVF